MKRKLLIASSVLFAQISFAQLWIPAGSSDMTSNISGNVGIGTSTPVHKLHIFGSNGSALIEAAGDGQASLNLKSNGTFWHFSKRNSGEGNALKLFYHNGTDFNYPPSISFNTNGNVGIGVDNPGSFKLAVEGKIGAREILVTLTNPWPDYVFKKSYSLLPLKSLDAYIKQNGHLPGIPSAAEVEQNGRVPLGDLSVKYLEKIEELTLYIIALKKEIDQLKEGKYK
jgi:hypothetical protein